MRVIAVTAVLACSIAAAWPAEEIAAQRRTPGSRLTTASTCAANLGAGVKSRRTFCDVMIGTTPAASVAMAIPPHTGTATLLFDLHNRFGIPAVAGHPGVSYTRQDAVISVIQEDGAIIGQAAVVREFRTVADLFDRIGSGGRSGEVKAVAPGPAEAVRFVIPAGVSTVGVVGDRVRIRTGTGLDEVYDAPGRPVAIVSNLRIEYRPAR